MAWRPEEPEPDIVVSNVVATAYLPHRVDLRSVRSVLPNAEVMHIPRETLVIRLKKPRATLRLYSSGKVVCTGARSIKCAEKAIKKLLRLLRRHNVILRRPVRVEINNVVVTADLHGEVDLEQAAWELGPRAMYEPEQFPGLIYRPDGSKRLRILVFHTGRAVVAGAQSEEEAREAVSRLLQELRIRGLIHRVEPSGTLPDGGSTADGLPSYFQGNPWLDILAERGGDPEDPGELLEDPRLEVRARGFPALGYGAVLVHGDSGEVEVRFFSIRPGLSAAVALGRLYVLKEETVVLAEKLIEFFHRFRADVNPSELEAELDSFLANELGAVLVLCL